MRERQLIPTIAASPLPESYLRDYFPTASALLDPCLSGCHPSLPSMSSMSNMKNIEIYQVVAGKRFQGGKVLKTFTSAEAHKCGGPATAALRASQRMSDKGIECHARKYHADLHGSLES